jgi:hypothetical protein
MNPGIVLLCAVLAAPLTPAFVADAKPLYDEHCRRCLGVSGEGNQKIASMMKVEIRHLGSAEVQKKSGAELKEVMVAGIGKMQPMNGLTAKHAVDLVALIRTTKK